MDFIKSLWYVHKIKAYEKLIINMTKAREKIKAKQLKFTERQEFYREKLRDSSKV